MLVSFPGADGMKTGFICDSGYNIVVSATRDGRKLVAVVLGEQSLALRRERAADLLDRLDAQLLDSRTDVNAIETKAEEDAIEIGPVNRHAIAQKESNGGLERL